jgi:hypothetical protein
MKFYFLIWGRFSRIFFLEKGGVFVVQLSNVRGTDQILRRKRKSRKDRPMRPSAQKSKQNHYVRSVQLNEETWDMADELCERYGVSYSKLVRRMTRSTFARHMQSLKSEAIQQERDNGEGTEEQD